MKYNEAYKEALDIGLVTKDVLEADLLKSGDWTKAHNDRIDKLSKEIQYVSNEIKVHEFNLGKKNLLKKRLERVKANHEKLVQTKEILFLNCAEQYAESYRYVWNIYNLISDVNGKPLWGSIKEFEQSNVDTIRELTHVYNRGFVLEESEVRKLARSGIWRILYGSVKSSVELFNRPVCDFDINQINLIYWTTIYNNVMESMEPPTDDILGNDAEFDIWSKSFSDKIKKERIKNSISPNNKSAGLTENFVMTDDAGADKLYADLGKPEIKFKQKAS